MENLKESVKNLKIADPVGCIKLLKFVATESYKKLQDYGKIDISKTVNDYESLLQKSELKIRDLIRVEQ